MRFEHNGIAYIITDGLNVGIRITERGIHVEDTIHAFRAYREMFVEKYGEKHANMPVNDMIEQAWMWEHEAAELRAEQDYADWCEVQDSMEFERMAGIW